MDPNIERDGEAIDLYRLHGCPYCEWVVRALQSVDLDYRSIFVPGEHRRRDIVRDLAGTRSVPVLVDHTTGVTMAESRNIVAYIRRTYGESGDSRDHSIDEVATLG